MRKKKKLLNLALLLSLGVGLFGPNGSAVFAEEPADEIVLESNESQTTEGSNENTEEELELEIPDSEEPGESISIDAVESESETQAEILEIEDVENENESTAQSVFYSNSDFEIKDGVLVVYRGNAATVKIPSSVKVIGQNAFKENTSLENVIFPSTVTEIQQNAFDGCSNLRSIDLTNIKIIEEFAFNGCTSLSNVHIPSSITRIEWRTFANCTGLKNLTFSPGCIFIGPEAFLNCSNLKSVSLSASVEVIGYCAFERCHGLKSIDLNSVKEIYKKAFYDSGLVDVTIPDSVETIESGAFYNCCNLEKISIGNNLDYLPSEFVRDCTKLKTVTMGNKIKEIKNEAFKGCTSLTSISLPDSVKSIGTNAFADCKRLKEIKFSKNLEVIGEWAFSNTALKSITIPDKVASIDVGAFSNISTLTSVYFPRAISTITEYKPVYGDGWVSGYGEVIFNNSPNVCLYLYSDHQYAIDYANSHNIPWRCRDKNTVQKSKTIKAESVGKNKVHLSWSKASGADKYLVQCWRNGKLQYKYTTKNNYLTDPKASDTTSNTYKVYSRMTRPDGTVVYSSQPAVVSALGICPGVTNVRANSTTSGGQIKWNKSYYNDGYIIYRSINKNGTGAVYAGTTRDVKFTDKKAKKGQLYYYWVYPYHNKNGKMILGEKPAESPRAKMK